MTEHTCLSCGAYLEDHTSCPKCGAEVNLETYGYSIKPAQRGGGFLLLQDNEGIKLVRESKKWLEKTSKEYKVPFELLEKALIQAKQTPRNKEEEQEPDHVEIITENLNHVSPDAGVVDGKAYVGLWLPVKITDPETEITRITHKFYLLFSDGELIPGTPAQLSQRGIYLVCNPVYSPARISVQTALSLQELTPVDPYQLLTKLIWVLETYIEFDDHRLYILNAIWIIGSYFYKRFGSFPYLFLNAVKRAGKTKLLTVLSLLSYNAIFSPNMSTASLFRLVQNNGCSLLLDETEDLDDPEKKPSSEAYY